MLMQTSKILFELFNLLINSYLLEHVAELLDIHADILKNKLVSYYHTLVVVVHSAVHHPDPYLEGAPTRKPNYYMDWPYKSKGFAPTIASGRLSVNVITILYKNIK